MRPVLGGKDPTTPCQATNYGFAVDRNLYPYLRESEVFRCAVDKGKANADTDLCPDESLLPSCWEKRGFSYEINTGAPKGLRNPPTLRPIAGLITGHAEAWIADTTRFILFYEPPASPHVCGVQVPHWYQWHRNRVKTDFLDPRLAPALFYSPILFLDGHARMLNFTRSLCTDPYYPFEETKDWVWYVPQPETANNAP